MAKMESTLKNMVLSLSLISMTMAAGLSLVFIMTKGPIEKADKLKEVTAVTEVLPSFDNDPIKLKKEIEGLTFYTATKAGQIVGCAVKTFTTKGFSGRFDLMVGFKPDGSINKIVVVDQKETPGLGAKMNDDAFRDQFKNKNLATFKLRVKKDGGQVDAISAATISSRAFCDGVQKAYDLYMKNFVKPTASVTAIAVDSTVVKGGTHE
jgi:electron transport complex protein RnfG